MSSTRTGKRQPNAMRSYRASPVREETNAIRQWWRNTKEGLVIMAILAGALAAMAGLTWLLVGGLREWASWVFVPLPRGSFIHLKSNSLLNQLALGAPCFLWLLMLASSIIEWQQSIWPKLPKRDKALRHARLRQARWRTTRIMGITTVVCLILAVPGMRSFEVLTADRIVAQGMLASSPDVYALKALTCIHRAVVGRGLIFWDFEFDDGRALSIAGPSREALKQLRFPTTCRSERDPS